MWIVCGRLEQDTYDKPWVIQEMDPETGELEAPMVFEDIDHARDSLAEHILVQQSIGSGNNVYALDVSTGEVVDLF